MSRHSQKLGRSKVCFVLEHVDWEILGLSRQY